MSTIADILPSTRAAETPHIGRLRLKRETSESRAPLVDAFIDRLGELRRAGWLEIGDRSLSRPDEIARRVAARMALDVALEHRDLVLAAWCVRDLVQTCAFSGSVPGTRASKRDRARLDAARLSVEGAALSLVARRRLRFAEFEALYAPVDRQIPLGSLRRRSHEPPTTVD